MGQLQQWRLTRPGRIERKYWLGLGGGWSDPDFIPVDNSGNTIEAEARDILRGNPDALALVALAYIAMNWRAQKISEPPLMVVEEDQKSGDEEWLDDHDLVGLLEEPALDYDMGQLIATTSWYLDAKGEAIWTIDRDRAGEPARLTPFHGDEFEAEKGEGRIRNLYRVSTSEGPKPFSFDDVIYFRSAPGVGPVREKSSRLGVACEWLRLGDSTRKAVERLVGIADWPNIVVQPNAEWNPPPKELEEYIDKIQMRQRQRKPLIMLGGGTASVVSTRIRDLVPDEVLDRVEGVVAAVFGVPAVVLQFLVGIRNSPWSQMKEARRMAYDDAIAPEWRMYERATTRQLLRQVDEDETHFFRFDTSKIPSLQPDRVEQAAIASQVSRIASVNERRVMVGLEPSDDPKADEIPELTQPDPMTLLGTGTEKEQQEKKRHLYAALRADQADRSVFEWHVMVAGQLENDRAEIKRLADRMLLGTKAEVPSPEQRKGFFAALRVYLENAKGDWERTVTPLIRKNADRAMASLASELGFSFDLVRPAIAAYVKREVAFLVTSITETTREKVQDAVTRGIEKGLGPREIAKALEELPAFNRDRALLVARTEATRVTNGAPTEALIQRQAETGTRFVKIWTTAGDARVRDEHVALEGERVPVDAAFSNGLAFPSEPNCRCTLLYTEEAA